jgi:hypothetical protein
MSDAPPREERWRSGLAAVVRRPAPTQQPAGGNFNDFEDDIPF